MRDWLGYDRSTCRLLAERIINRSDLEREAIQRFRYYRTKGCNSQARAAITDIRSARRCIEMESRQLADQVRTIETLAKCRAERRLKASA